MVAIISNCWVQVFVFLNSCTFPYDWEPHQIHTVLPWTCHSFPEALSADERLTLHSTRAPPHPPPLFVLHHFFRKANKAYLVQPEERSTPAHSDCFSVNKQCAVWRALLVQIKQNFRFKNLDELGFAIQYRYPVSENTDPKRSEIRDFFESRHIRVFTSKNCITRWDPLL